MRTAKTLISLGGYSFCWFCHEVAILFHTGIRLLSCFERYTRKKLAQVETRLAASFTVWTTIRAASWPNQQCGCASSWESDQPWHQPSLIRVFAVRMKKAWVLSYSTHWAHRKDSDQTGRRPRLIWVFAGRTVILLVLSRGGSFSYSKNFFIPYWPGVQANSVDPDQPPQNDQGPHCLHTGISIKSKIKMKMHII